MKSVPPMTDYLDELTHTIKNRRDAASESSYVASLFAIGEKKIAQKVAEEAVEVVIAAVSEGREAVINEAADLLFHLLVLFEFKGIAFEEIVDELRRREGLSGLTEKANRGDAG